jgi:hypothetical protein
MGFRDFPGVFGQGGPDFWSPRDVGVSDLEFLNSNISRGSLNHDFNASLLLEIVLVTDQV